MPVKSTRFKTQTIFDGEITGLNEREKNVLKKAGIGGASENALVAPTGLTKTELVGVGTNGQENIEIGDNLTLANGKLSATGGGSGVQRIAIEHSTSTGQGTYTGKFNNGTDSVYFTQINGIARVLNTMADGLVGYALQIGSVSELGCMCNVYEIGSDPVGYKVAQYIIPTMDLFQQLQPKLYSHFITITSSTAGSINFNYTNIAEDVFTIDTLKEALASKSITCSGYIKSSGANKFAKYIAGEAGGLSVGWFDISDGSTGVTAIDDTFSISDKPTPVE